MRRRSNTEEPILGASLDIPVWQAWDGRRRLRGGSVCRGWSACICRGYRRRRLVLVHVEPVRTTAQVGRISCAWHDAIRSGLEIIRGQVRRAIALCSEFDSSDIIASRVARVDALLNRHWSSWVDLRHDASLNRVGVASLAGKAVVRVENGWLSCECIA